MSIRNIKLTSLLLVFTLAMVILPAAIATTAETDGNEAPVTENLEYTTYRNVSVSGYLLAVDPEGDMLEYRMVTEPKKGTVELYPDAGFTYTPGEDKKGKDKFTYVAIDSVGNISEESTVTVKIEKQSTDVTYSDMEGHASEYAALVLAENGIFVGERLGDNYFFNPDYTVSRGDFLAMCMDLTDMEIIPDVTRTGFSDDEDIAAWMKPYVTTAVMNGIVQGYSANGEIIFSGNASATLADASVILNNILQLSDVGSSGNVQDAQLVPTWAYQATINLSSSNIIPSDLSDVYNEELTRAEAAEMLSAAMGLTSDASGNSLLSWVF